jgi:hypothetical protein
MTGDEFQLALRAFLQRRPFRPFALQFISGKEIVLPHPEAIDRYGDLFLCRGSDRIRRIFTAASVCQVMEGASELELP